MLRRLTLVIALAALPKAAHAQTTADGVQAVLRGDYQTGFRGITVNADGRWFRFSSAPTTIDLASVGDVNPFRSRNVANGAEPRKSAVFCPKTPGGILAPARKRSAVREFTDHSTCLALASVLKGELCETLFAEQVRELSKGARVYQPGDPADSLYRVVTGSVGLSSVAPNGEEVMLRMYTAGDVFGELCFCRGVQMHFATALEPGAVASAHAQRVLTTLTEHPSLALDLIRVLSERLAAAYAELHGIAADSLVTRLARKLFELCAVDDGDGWCRLARHFTHDELARLLAVRRESLTRAMIDLRALGLIDYGAHAPVKVALPALRRFIGRSRSADLLPHRQTGPLNRS